MEHDDFCYVGAHRPPPDETTRPTSCVGSVEAEVPGIGAWLSGSDRGTVVELDHRPGVSLLLQDGAEFAYQMLQMCLRAGAVMPRPATDQG